MRSFRFSPRALALLLALDGSALLAQAPAAVPEPASFKRLEAWIAREDAEGAAAELAAIATQAGPVQPAAGPAEREILRRAIEIGRRRLSTDPDADARRVSRQLLCRARAYFTEELPDPPTETGEPAEPLRVGGGVRRPEIVGSILPQYTPEARENKVTGVVITEAVIDREGCVRNLRVLKGLPMGLPEAAVAAARNWAFEPATLDGKPVKVYYILTINFQLDKQEKGSAERR